VFAQQFLDQPKLSQRRYKLVFHKLDRIAQSSKAHRAESMSVMGHELTGNVISYSLCIMLTINLVRKAELPFDMLGYLLNFLTFYCTNFISA